MSESVGGGGVVSIPGGRGFARETRATIRRRVGSLTNKMAYGAVLTGAASGFTAEFLAGSPDNGPLVGRGAYVVSGTGSGQLRVITSTTQATKAATVTPAWDTIPDATSVIEAWGDDASVSRVNDLINLAILHVQERIWVPARENPGAIDASFRTLTLPTDFVGISSFRYMDSAGTWYTYKMAQDPAYLSEHPRSIALIGGWQAVINPVLTASVDLTDQWLIGYKRPGTLETDDQAADVRSDYLTYLAAYYLEAGEAEGQQLDPQDHGGRAGNWLREVLRIEAGGFKTPIEPDTQEIY